MAGHMRLPWAIGPGGPGGPSCDVILGIGAARAGQAVEEKQRLRQTFTPKRSRAHTSCKQKRGHGQPCIDEAHGWPGRADWLVRQVQLRPGAEISIARPQAPVLTT